MKKINSEEIVRMRKEGLSYSQICEKTGFSKGTISKYCRGINENFAIYEKITKTNKDDIDKSQKIYDDGYSLREVSKIVGINRTTLSKYLIIRNRKLKSEDESRKDDIERVKIWKRKLRDDLVEHRGGKCVVCGYDKSIRALHFHHLDLKEKLFRVSVGSVSKELLLKESEKCILVCSNCHCEIHDELYKKGYSDIINKIGK